MFGLQNNNDNIYDDFLFNQDFLLDQDSKEILSDTNSQPHVDSLSTSPTGYDDSESSGENGISKVANSQFSSAPAFANDSMNGNPNSLLLDKKLPTINYPSSTMSYFSQASFPIQQINPTQLTGTRYPSSQQISILANQSFPWTTTTTNLESIPFSHLTKNPSQSHLPEASFTLTSIDPNFIGYLEALNKQKLESQSSRKRKRADSAEDPYLSDSSDQKQLTQKNKRIKVTSLSSTTSNVRKAEDLIEERSIQFTQPLTQETNNLINSICTLIEELNIDEAELREKKWDIASLQKNDNSTELKAIIRKLKNRKSAALSRAAKKTTLIDIQNSIESEHVKIKELALKISELIGSCKIFISMYGQRPEGLIINPQISQQIDTIASELNSTVKLQTFPKLPEQQVIKATENMTKKEKNKLTSQNFREKEIQTRKLYESYLIELKSKTTELILKQQQIQNIFNSFKEYFMI